MSSAVFSRFVLVSLLCLQLASWGVVGSPATLDLVNGDPTWLSYADMSNYSSRIVSKVNSKGAAWPTSSTIQTVTLVCARETLIGCHSFSSFLSPSAVTIFVFDRWTADPIYGLTKWVSSLNSTKTLGAFLIITDEHYGEVFSRKVAYDMIMAKGLGNKVQTLFSINCDIHPINTNHKLYKDYPAITTELYSVLTSEMRLRASGKTAVFNTATGRNAFGVFAIYPVILETLPTSNSTLFGAVQHGNDVAGFSGVYHQIKPSSLGTKKWIVDSLSWPEGHVLMINFPLLKAIASEYFSMVQYLSEERVLPPFLTRHKMTVLRHNEVATNFQLARSASDLSNPAYASSVLDMELLKLRNYEILALARSPWRMNTTFFALESRKISVQINIMFASAFDAQRIKQHWIPSAVSGSAGNVTLNDDVGKRFFGAQMLIAGYYEDPSYHNTTVRRYVMKRVYPTVYLVTMGSGLKDFGGVMQGKSVTQYFTNDWNTKTYGGKSICGTLACMNKLSLASRTIDVPRTATIQNAKIPHIVNQASPLTPTFSISATGGISTTSYFTQVHASP
eukprot:TRINITY_DN1724_c0_g1_i1.p1 TRINITY_DN1724_c0_g1~~TRINITY_DN1724_c0_g1_i1.p1  ORF type:complete len:562 (-),score=100.05 TRINITY_DN1724_c0_g1_i1:88-1773(-)